MARQPLDEISGAQCVTRVLGVGVVQDDQVALVRTGDPVSGHVYHDGVGVREAPLLAQHVLDLVVAWPVRERRIPLIVEPALAKSFLGQPSSHRRDLFADIERGKGAVSLVDVGSDRDEMPTKDLVVVAHVSASTTIWPVTFLPR